MEEVFLSSSTQAEQPPPETTNQFDPLKGLT